MKKFLKLIMVCGLLPAMFISSVQAKCVDLENRAGTLVAHLCLKGDGKLSNRFKSEVLEGLHGLHKSAKTTAGVSRRARMLVSSKGPGASAPKPSSGGTSTESGMGAVNTPSKPTTTGTGYGY